MEKIVLEGEPKEEELDPKVEKVRRKLMRFMLMSTLMTMALIGAVLFAVIYKIMHSPSTPIIKRQPTLLPNAPITSDNTPSLEPKTANLTLPEGMKIVSQSLNNNGVLCLQLQDSAGQTTFMLFDYQRNKVLYKINLSKKG